MDGVQGPHQPVGPNKPNTDPASKKLNKKTGITDTGRDVVQTDNTEPNVPSPQNDSQPNPQTPIFERSTSKDSLASDNDYYDAFEYQDLNDDEVVEQGLQDHPDEYEDRVDSLHQTKIKQEIKDFSKKQSASNAWVNFEDDESMSIPNEEDKIKYQAEELDGNAIKKAESRVNSPEQSTMKAEEHQRSKGEGTNLSEAPSFFDDDFVTAEQRKTDAKVTEQQKNMEKFLEEVGIADQSSWVKFDDTPVNDKKLLGVMQEENAVESINNITQLQNKATKNYNARNGEDSNKIWQLQIEINEGKDSNNNNLTPSEIKEREQELKQLQQQIVKRDELYDAYIIQTNEKINQALETIPLSRKRKIRLSQSYTTWRQSIKPTHLKSKTLSERIKSLWQTVRSAFLGRKSAKIQKAESRTAFVELAFSPKYEKLMSNPTTAKTLDAIWHGKLKNNVAGKQKVHELMQDHLMEAVNFSEDDKDTGFATSLTSLVLVHVGLMDGHQKGKSDEEYRGLESPAAKATGVPLNFNASQKDRDNLVALVKEKRTLPFASKKITRQQFEKALDLVEEAVKEKEAVIQANQQAIQEGRVTDVKDPDAAAKEKLIELVLESKPKALPQDLKAKLEVQRNVFNELNMADLTDDEFTGRVEIIPDDKQYEQIDEQIKQLTEKIAEESEKYVERKRSPLPLHTEKVSARMAKLKAQIKADMQLKEQLQERKMLYEQQAYLYSETFGKLLSAVDETKSISAEGCEQIIKGIMVHCGILISDDPLEATNLDSLKLSRAKISKKQLTVAKKVARRVHQYLKHCKESETKPQSAEIDALITGYQPVSAFSEKGSDLKPSEHPLNQTQFKNDLAKQLTANDYSVDKLETDTKKILSKSSFINADDKAHQGMLDVLSLGIMEKVMYPRRKKADVATPVDIQRLPTEEEVKKVRQLARGVVEFLKKDGATAATLAKHIYPKNANKRKDLASKLNTVMVKS